MGVDFKLLVIFKVIYLTLNFSQCTGQGSGTDLPYLVGISPIVTFVRENSDLMQEVVDLHAYDRDNTLISYSLSTSTPFDIDSNRGVVFVSGPLDREVEDRYTLTAQVTDQDGQSGTIEIEVTILDVNDNVPNINNSLTVSVRENTEVGTRIHSLIATDPDQGNAGSVEFTLLTSGDLVTDRSFTITRFSGNIILSESLDHEAIGTHVLLVRIADQGTPVQSRIVNVTIMVLDESDHAPVFSRSLYTATVSENSSTGTSVTRVLAIDADNLGATIFYSIVLGNVNGAFRVEDDGLVLVEGFLDREMRSRYILTIQADEGTGSDALAAFTTVTVQVDDENDNTPTFHASLYTGFLREDAALGSNVITSVSAFDLDVNENAEFQYRLAANTDEPFAIDPNTGIIRVNGLLDYEVQFEFEFFIEVYEVRTEEMHTDRAFVHIFLLDVNDNPPMFEFEIYNVSVYEERNAGEMVDQIGATDLDAGLAGVLTYSLQGFGSDRYSVDDVGTIRTTRVLDREDIDVYQLTLIATDSTTTPLHDTAAINIRVLDINDNCPEFDANQVTSFELLEEMEHQNFYTPIVEDRDTGLNGLYFFNITTTHPESFVVNSNTGALSLIRAVDHDETNATRTLSVLMTACDQGTMPEMLCCNQTITITIIDRNDNTPQFTMDPFTVQVYENFTEGSTLLIANAVDIDQGTNAELRYTFVSNEDAGPFLINHATGAITTVSSLDWETQPSFTIQVRAEDRGQPPLVDIATVEITVLDVNEFTPFFNDSIIHVALHETAAVGYIIATLTAYDPDGQSDGRIVYQFQTPNITRFFSIGEFTGEVAVVDPPDREMYSNLAIVVSATDQGNPMLSSSIILNVTVIDDNDNCPEFQMLPYTVSVSESLPTGGEVIQITATDQDIGSNAELEYSLNANSPPQFSINRDTGLITVDSNYPLDYETNQSYTFIVSVTDMGSVPCERITSVSVLIEDANDNRCAFVEDEYIVMVMETEELSGETPSAENPNPILTFSATDDDKPDTNNSRIQYFISQRDDLNLLALNSNNGELILQNGMALDRDRSDINQAPNCRALLRYRIEGRDQGNPSLSCFVDAYIYIQDINDNQPVFADLPDPVRVSEGTSVGLLAFVVRATDADCGTNAEIIYEIIDGNDMDSFSINSSNGDVNVNNVLDRELVSEYYLMVSAHNVVNQEINSVIIIHISIVDNNDNNPVCTPSLIQLCINETHPLTEPVASPNCTDPDDNNVTYGFRGGNINGTFTIDAGTGIISLATLPDRESIDFYHLTVYAEDTGVPPRRGFTEVTVCILDVNDNCPVFTQNNYTGSITENAVVGTPVTLQNFVSASDADAGFNAVVRYGFGNGSLGHFAIADTTGFITVADSTIDRENVGIYNIVLTATDGPGCVETALLIIEVLDTNDNNPFFTISLSSVEVCEDFPIGTLVTTFRAEDLDIGNNGFITYALVNSNEDFAIGYTTGNLTINQGLDRERVATYNITVVAFDNGLPPRSSSTFVLVTVQDINDNSPVFNDTIYDVCVPENSNTGTVVIQLFAIDADTGSNGRVTYSVLSTDAPFSIGFEDGIITSLDRSALDREKTSEYIVTIQATDSGNMTGTGGDIPSTKCPTVTANRATSVDVRICLTDINDNCPLFSQANFVADVLEETSSNAIVHHITASDIDVGTNAEIVYRINASIPVSGLNLFNIDENTGIIRTTVNLNREELDAQVYVLQLLAVDQGMPPCTSNTTVTLRIRDVNDHNPVCNQTFYDFAIEENLNSAVVGGVDAYELDLNDNGVIDFTIANYSRQDDVFSINMATGVITTRQPLDREQFSSYVLTIVVTDRGNSSRVGYCTAFVSVLYQNDECPMFAIANGTRSYVIENASPQVIVGQASSSDDDIGTNAMVSYTIAAGDDTNAFDIQSNGNIVTTGFEIDRETMTNFSLIICANDSVCVTCSNVIVVVQDSCDHLPTFTNLPQEISINETAVIGTTVTRITAVDLDLGVNGLIRYSISTGNVGSKFAIGEFSGVITIANPLDYESNNRVYVMEITATDFCSDGERNQTEMLTVRVINENDNGPECPFIPLLNATEKLNVNNFYTYIATDADDPPFNGLAYTIASIATGNVFEIESSNALGLISVANGEILDQRSVPIYCETIVVFDSDMIRNCTVQLCVSVIDANDNCPMFTVPHLNTAVSEGSHIGTLVDTVTAVDNDLGTNAQFDYFITGGTGQGSFSINSNGEINTTVLLDREAVASYTLQLETRDMGTPSQSCSATVNITVLDSNDNSPVITNCMGRLVEENADFGTVLINMDATDLDIGENGRVSYHLGNNSNNFGPFQINSVTGEITTVRPLDRESEDFYTLTIHATDHGIPPARESACTISINVTDLNDNLPSFVSNAVITICENVAVGPDVAQLNELVFDLDIAPNNVIYYYNFFNPGSNCFGKFCIETTTGDISLSGELDFETAPSHAIPVAISNFIPFPTDFTQYRVANVTILVCDINDVTPRFINTFFIAAVSETSDIGDIVFQISATDPESGDFGIVWYRSVSQNAAFTIDIETGTVMANAIFQGKAGTSFLYEIEAYDNKGSQPSLTARQAVTIWVLRNQQRVIITFDIARDIVIAKQNLIVNTLNSATGYRIAIEKIRLAESDDESSVDASRTDVLVYGIDTETNTIVDAITVISVIDANFGRISTGLAECKLQTARPFPILTNVEASRLDDEIWFIIIGSLAVFVLLLCCCLLCCCVVAARRRKLRKTKKTVETYETSLRQFAAEQNTNTNPLWLAPYNQWEHGSETQEIRFEDEDEEETNPLYESKEVVMEMLPEPDTADPSTISLIEAVPPKGAQGVRVVKSGSKTTTTMTRVSGLTETSFTSGGYTNAGYNTDSMGSEAIQAMLDKTLDTSNRDSVTMEILAAVASDEEIPSDNDDDAALL